MTALNVRQNLQLNDRQRFYAAMHYQTRDRVPLLDFNFWNDTLPHWHKQGLPRWVNRRNEEDYFGVDYSLDNMRMTWVRDGLFPAFQKKVLEDRGEARVLQQRDGVRVLRQKTFASIPHPIAYLLKDRESWENHYKPRLDPEDPGRYPKDWEARVKEWTDPERCYPVVLPGGSLYGWLRNWMGMESLSVTLYDDPAWFEEMVTTVADCIIGVLDRILSTGGQFEAVSMWEDMAYNRGPLMSPKHFKQFLSPHYRRISDLVRKHGVDVIYLDCDGKIDALLPLWLEAGINCMYPIEVGTWGGDPVAFRKKYGKDLLMMGGFDKHILAQGKQEIKAEVYRLLPLVEEGGYIPYPDHRVPPDVPYENYLYFIELARNVWGHGINLPPQFVRNDNPVKKMTFFYW
jgi:uroporphyrinogen decarboxylase